jgi:hypothetical protein
MMGRGQGAVRAPGERAYSFVDHSVQVVFDHSWRPTARPPTRGDVIYSHPLHRGGNVAFHALSSGVFCCLVHAGVPAH